MMLLEGGRWQPARRAKRAAIGWGSAAAAEVAADPRKRKGRRGDPLFGSPEDNEGPSLARTENPPVLGLGWKVGRFQFYDPVVQPLYVPLVRKFKKRVGVSSPLASLPGSDPPTMELVLEPTVASSGEAAVLALDSGVDVEKAATPPVDNAESIPGAGDPSNPRNTPGSAY